MSESRPLCPVLDGDWWPIGPKPDLTAHGLQPPADSARINEPNDHTVFQSADGRWHLWACVRNTAAGRVLCHWEAGEVTQSPWELTGEVIRADREAGESLVEFRGQEFLQSPFVVRENDTYYLFYGGYDTGLGPEGELLDPAQDYANAEKQICLMISPDGRRWTRYRNDQGLSRVFMGPGAARDECVVKFGDTWYIYYAGHHDRDRTRGGIYVRTSNDLLHWSDWRIAHFDTDQGERARPFLAESPVVVERGGFYYLFRTHGKDSGTYVFRSNDPLDFGQGDIGDRAICRLPIIAPEIVIDSHGNEYISRINDGAGNYAIHLCRLRWEPGR